MNTTFKALIMGTLAGMDNIPNRRRSHNRCPNLNESTPTEEIIAEEQEDGFIKVFSCILIYII